MIKYPNFTCHIDFNFFGDNGFHSKGYLSPYNDTYEFIVGSTNITIFTLLKNVEWNVSLLSKESLDSIDNAYIAYDELLKKTLLLNNDIISRYSLILDYAIEKWDMDYFNPEYEGIKPNSM